MEAQRIIVICFAGLSSGAALGAFMRTQTEVQGGRRGRGFWSPFDRLSVFGMLLNELLKLMFIAGLIVAGGALTLQIGDVYPLAKPDTQLLAVAWLVGAGLAKWIRYRYWKSQPAGIEQR